MTGEPRVKSYFVHLLFADLFKLFTNQIQIFVLGFSIRCSIKELNIFRGICHISGGSWGQEMIFL